MTTFYIMVLNAEKKVEWKSIEGVEVKNDLGVTLFVDHRGKSNWVVSEARTGVRVYDDKTKSKAIEGAIKLLEAQEPQELQERLNRYVKERGESPLFAKKLLKPKKLKKVGVVHI